MQINNISNQNFGTLKYNPTARKIIIALIKDNVVTDANSAIRRLCDGYHATGTQSLHNLADKINKAGEKLHKTAENTLNTFKDALEHAAKSDALKVRILHRTKSAKSHDGIVVTINDEQFVHRKYSSMLNFINKISTKILSK